MDKQQLEAIRARDADYNDVFEAQASMSKDIAHRLVAWPVADRRALLAHVDELREAAGNVTCLTCGNTGRASLKMPGSWGAWTEADCPDCADLRRLLGEKT